MPSVTVLHLSDFHFDTKKWEDEKLLTRGLIEDIPVLARDYGMKPDLILFSGDLVNAGSRASLDELETKLIDPLLDAASLDRTKIVIVPGNHDIDRERVRANKALQTGLMSTLTTRGSANEFVDQHINTAVGDAHFSRLEEFSGFAARFGTPYNVRSTPFFSTYRIELDSGLTVGVAALNTAWLSSGEANDIDRGKLIVPERAVMHALDDLKGVDFTIASMHHPFEYLVEFNRHECRALLQKHCDFVCTGHLHNPIPTQVHSAAGQCVFNESGALYSNRENYFMGYSIVCFDLDKRKVDFVHRRWEDSPAYRFDEANNVAPKGRHSFFLEAPSEITKAKSLIDVNLAVKADLTEQANEHMLSAHANTTAPKSFVEMYVEPPIGHRSNYETSSPAVTRTYTSVSEILASDIPVAVYGRRETGKTSFAYDLCLKVCDGANSRIRVPILVNLDLVTAGSGSISRVAKQALGLGGAQASYAEMAASGDFVFVFDNVSSSDSRKIGMITKFVKEYPKNAFVLIVDEGLGLLHTKSATETFGFECKSAYIHPLNRATVRALTKRWLEPSGRYSNTMFHAVLKKIASSNLPATAYVVSMIAWTLEKESAVGLINESALLERFIEGILNKSSPNELHRGFLDYTVKEAFLSELAHKLVEGDTFTITKNGLVAFAVDFIESRSWTHHADAFVKILIDSGILVESGSLVAFRYRCLREYFLARYMMDNVTYRNEVIEPGNYLKFSRELDIYTGLRRKDADIVQLVREYTKDAMDTEYPDVDVELFDKVKFKYGGEGRFADRPKSLEELEVSDETIEALLDERDLDIIGGERTDLDAAERTKAERVDGLVHAYSSMILLNKVVRNSELIVDKELKTAATKEAIGHFATLLCLIINSFENLVSTLEHDADGALSDVKFAKLKPEAQQMVEHFIKVSLPAFVSMVLRDTLGTTNLVSTLKKLLQLEGEERLPTVSRMLIAFLLLDISCNQGVDTGNVGTREVEQFIKVSGNRYLNEIACEKLLTLYMTPNLGDANRSNIERIYADTRLRAEGLTFGKGSTGATKSELMRRMRAQREKSVESEEAEPEEGGGD